MRWGVGGSGGGWGGGRMGVWGGGVGGGGGGPGHFEFWGPPVREILYVLRAHPSVILWGVSCAILSVLGPHQGPCPYLDPILLVHHFLAHVGLRWSVPAHYQGLSQEGSDEPGKRVAMRDG